MIHIRILIFLAVLFVPGFSAAQEDESGHRFGFRDDSTVKGEEARHNPFSFRGVPLEMGGFLLQPNLTLGQHYVSNIRASENNEESDFITAIVPRLTVKNAAGRHNFSWHNEAEVKRYWENSSENTVDYESKFNAELEVRHNLHVPLSLNYASTHESRAHQRQASPGMLTQEPLAVDTTGAGAGLVYKPGRFMLTLLGGYEQKTYEDGTLTSGARAVRHDRDHDSYQAEFKASYTAPTGWSPFSSVTMRHEDYRRGGYTGGGFNGPVRDNNFLRFLTGFDFDYKGLVYGTLAAGYETLSYSDNRISDTDGVSLKGLIYWEPIQKMRFSAEILKDTREDNLVAAGIDRLYGGVKTEYELRRDVFARLIGAYENENFSGSAREDDTLSGGLALRYISSNHIQFGAEYLYESRDSNITGVSYENNSFILRLTGAL